MSDQRPLSPEDVRKVQAVQDRIVETLGTMTGPARGREPPIRLEHMLLLVEQTKRGREMVRRHLREEGALKEPIDDRTQLTWERLAEFLGHCITCRDGVNAAIRPAMTRWPSAPREEGER